MRTKHLKLIVLLLIGLAILACASRDALQLPPPLAPGGADSGWKDY